MWSALVQAPGTFYFSVLDNGVTSSEFWRIVDCADNLSWALFYYAGAASVVGLTYRGAVLVSRFTQAIPSCMNIGIALLCLPLATELALQPEPVSEWNCKAMGGRGAALLSW